MSQTLHLAVSRTAHQPPKGSTLNPLVATDTHGQLRLRRLVNVS